MLLWLKSELEILVSQPPDLSESKQVPNDTLWSMWVFRSLSLSLLTSVQLNTKSGLNPAPGCQVTGSILHPAGGLGTADFSEGEQVGAWKTQPGKVLPTFKCSWCSGLHLSFWSPFACQFCLGGASQKSGWVVRGWVSQSICTRLLWKLVLTFSPSSSGCFHPLPRMTATPLRAQQGKQSHDSHHKWQPDMGLAWSHERWEAPLQRKRQKTAVVMIIVWELVTVDLFVGLINFLSLINCCLLAI